MDVESIVRKMRSPVVWIPAFVFLVSLVPRLLLLSKGPFHFDTVDFLVSMRDKSVTFHESSFPVSAFFIIALGFLRDLLLPHVSYLSVLLLTTALFAAASAVVAYLVFAHLYGRMRGLVFALLVSFFPPYFSITTFGRIDHALALIFLSLALFYFLKEKKHACILFSALSIATRPENLMVFSGYFTLIFFQSSRAKGASLQQRLTTAAKRFSALFFPTIILVIAFGAFVPHWGWFSRVILRFLGKEDNYDTAQFFGYDTGRVLSALLTSVKVTVGIPLVLAAWGIYVKIRERDLAPLVLYLVQFFASFLFLAHFEAFCPRHLILPFYFLAFFMSVAIVKIFRKLRTVMLFTALAVVLMIYPVFSVMHIRHLHAYQLDFVEFLTKVTEPGSLIIANDTKMFLDYYTNGREVIQTPMIENRIDFTKFRSTLKEAFYRKRPVYLVSTAFTYDPYFIFRRFIEDNFYIDYKGQVCNEDWHMMEVESHLYYEKIFRLIPKTEFLLFSRMGNSASYCHEKKTA